MIGYITLGTNNLEKAAAFYDALLGELSAKRVWQTDRLMTWGFGKDKPMLGIIKPYDGQSASPGNGTMVALAVGSQENVAKLHAKALALGGKDEGAPGPRTKAFFGAYARDLDGNKLCFFHMG